MAFLDRFAVLLLDMNGTFMFGHDRERAEPCDPFAVNEVRLLLAGISYNLMHAGRALLEAITRTGWSLERFLVRVLKVPARCCSADAV